jgi:hypothetical protein
LQFIAGDTTFAASNYGKPNAQRLFSRLVFDKGRMFVVVRYFFSCTVEAVL